jgi:hypothetical protein
MFTVSSTTPSCTSTCCTLPPSMRYTNGWSPRADWRTAELGMDSVFASD